MNMVEQLGSGIKRIKTAISNAGLAEPIFKTEGLFTIVFKKNITKKLEDIPLESSLESSLLILKLISKNERIKRMEWQMSLK